MCVTVFASFTYYLPTPAPTRTPFCSAGHPSLPNCLPPSTFTRTVTP